MTSIIDKLTEAREVITKVLVDDEYGGMWSVLHGVNGTAN
jgi:hypothetical protein